ncbi:hypothetical protein D6C83_08956 [Aureobasidium pullulans]|uniref:Uncharacterized protein n=1 Tax=Aureobasidium pullulans TaxID=5580 RepID=A0A4S9ZCZ3_AURPU|nr:hypothetical protein D6C83_08956 [Aureobasidium pullulans]
MAVEDEVVWQDLYCRCKAPGRDRRTGEVYSQRRSHPRPPNRTTQDYDQQPLTCHSSDRNNTPIQATVGDIIVDTPKNLTALTAEDLAASILVHEARTRVTKWIMETENPPRILVRAEYSDKVLLGFNITLNKDSYSIMSDKMVQSSLA